MRRVGLLAALVLSVLFFAACGGSKAPQFTGAAAPSIQAPNFALEDESGRPISVASQRGHWLVVTFLYTHCPDVCPLIAAHLNGALTSAAGKRAQLHVIAVSVDPRRDTLTAVRRYVVTHRLAPSFHWAIGTRAQLARVWRAYHVAAQPGPKGTVTHSTFEILVDPEGKERLIYDQSMTTAQLTGDLTTLAAT
jgi:protein SCO1